MGSLKQRLKSIEHDALWHAVLTECRRVCFLFDMEQPSEIAAVEVEALRLITNPQLAPEFTPEQLETERQVMYDAARRRGIDLDTVKADIDRLVDTLVAEMRAQ